MAFGLDAGISRTTTNTVNVAEQLGPDGTILDMTTHGGSSETQEEIYLSGAFTNEALNGQTGTEVVSSHVLTETNADYARVTKTTREALAAGS